MVSGALEVSQGDRLVFAIAGLGVRLDSELEGALRLPGSFRPFVEPLASVGLHVRARAVDPLEPAAGELLFDSALHWRALRCPNDDVVFELSHPPSRERYCRMAVDPGFSRAEIVFDAGTWRRLGAVPGEWLLPHPLDQLLIAPALALRGVCLFHACGAAMNGEALVFAGHSGEGKTTLARLLGAEGVELLSDERVALRRSDGGFIAHGTPWPGEGDVVSTASYPLRGLFLLRKAERHGIEAASRSSGAAELTARAIVPYYLPEVARSALELLGEIVAEAPVRRLGFNRSAGLRSLLAAAPA